MKGGAALLWRGVRWRLGISLLTVLTSAVAVGAAVLGPLYLRTAGDSVLRRAISSASVEDRGVTLGPPPGQAASLSQLQGGERLVRAAAGRWFGSPITSVLSGVTIATRRSGAVRSQLLSRTGICRQLHFVQGSCATGLGEVAVSQRSARELGVSSGEVIGASVPGRNRPLALRITGIYSVPDFGRSYWWGDAVGYFPFGQTTSGEQRLPEIDSLIASPATALAVPPADSPEITGQIPLRAGRVGLSAEAGVRAALTRARVRLAARGLTLSTELTALFDGSDRQRHTMSAIVAVAAIQLVLLAVWVLGGLLLRGGATRQAEIRVARLRGFPARSLLAVIALEPAALCAVGLLLGLGAAWGAMVFVRAQILDRAAAISPDGWMFAALGASVAAIAGVLGLGLVRVLRSSTLAGSAQTERRPARTRGALADVALLILSVVGVVALVTNGSLSGHSNPIASAAPGLIALGTAVIAVQLVLFACRLGVSASADSKRIALFIALRQIVRRPALLRQTRVLIIALALACFAVSAWSVARSNRAAAARFAVGTARVATVSSTGTGLEQAVERADPKGRFAMAAVLIRTGSSTLLAVQAPRLGAAVAWPAGISRASLARIRRRIDPAVEAPVELPDTTMRLQATSLSVTSASAGRARGKATAIRGSVDLAAWVLNSRLGTTILNLGPLRLGASSYQARLEGACPGGCQLAGLGLVPVPGQSAPARGATQLTVHGLRVRSDRGRWTPLGADLFPHGWRAGAGGVRVRSGARGSMTFEVPAAAVSSYTDATAYATAPMVAPADHPAVLPGVVTSEVQSLNGAATSGGVVPGQGLDGNTLNVGSAATASALPRVGADAVMVDLGLLERYQVNPLTPYASDEVWLGPAAGADALSRLRAAGLRVERVQSASAVFAALQRSAPALADDFLLVAAIIALLAAAASTLGALGANTRQRAIELTGLQVAGVPRRALTGALALESAALAATALFGAGAGAAAATIAIPSLPELATPALIPLRYALPGGLVIAVAAAVVAVILLAGGAVATVVLRRMSPVLLRMAPDDSTG